MLTYANWSRHATWSGKHDCRPEESGGSPVEKGARFRMTDASVGSAPARGSPAWRGRGADAARPYGRRSRRRNLSLSVGLFPNDQSCKYSNLCIWHLHAVCLRHRVLWRAGLKWSPYEKGRPGVKRAARLTGCYRLSRLAWAASRCRLRFLVDRRRRFMTAFAGLIDAPDARREMPGRQRLRGRPFRFSHR
jgi:hypothetical protein